MIDDTGRQRAAGRAVIGRAAPPHSASARAGRQLHVDDRPVARRVCAVAAGLRESRKLAVASQPQSIREPAVRISLSCTWGARYRCVARVLVSLLWAARHRCMGWRGSDRCSRCQCQIPWRWGARCRCGAPSGHWAAAGDAAARTHCSRCWTVLDLGCTLSQRGSCRRGGDGGDGLRATREFAVTSEICWQW